MNILKFFLAFFLVAGVILGLVIGLNWTAFKVVFSDPATFSEGSEWIEQTYSITGLVDYIEANPQHVSLVSLNLDNPQQSVLFQEKEPRVLGATASLFLLMEFERQRVAGQLDPNEKVEISELDTYLVPGWYESAHKNTVRILSRNDDTVRIETLLTHITQRYNQAISDWLFFRLGPENVNALIDSLGNGHVDHWTPGAGIQASVIMREEGQDKKSFVAGLYERSAEYRAKHFTEIAIQYAEDQDFRNQVHSRAGSLRNRLLADERAIHGLYSRAQPLKFTEIFALIYEGNFLTAEACDRILEYFTWAYEDPVVQQHATEYGALFGSRLSYLTGIDFGTSVYTSETFVQSLFFDDLPVAFFMHMSSNYMNQDMQRRLIYDPELRRITDLVSRKQLNISNVEEAAQPSDK